jgi:hypothetical protein
MISTLMPPSPFSRKSVTSSPEAVFPNGRLFTSAADSIAEDPRPYRVMLRITIETRANGTAMSGIAELEGIS